jgi:arylsulfatase
LGRGFERFYGFFGGETNQFAPSLYYDNHRVPAPQSWEAGYHLTEDLADRAIEFVRDLKAAEPTKPFFLYFCPGACHSPHQAPSDWIAHYQGKFDDGWDAWREKTLARQKALGIIPQNVELSPRPDWVPSWDSLSADQRRLYARFMECFAAYLSHADHQIGRLIEVLRDLGELDNTLLFVLSDNGASSEGGPGGSLNDVRTWNVAPTALEEGLERMDEIGGPFVHNNYPWGWTVAGNTPFRRWKREVHEGGIADPLIVHWPAGIPVRGEVRKQYAHAIDVFPTILDILNTGAPSSLNGVPQKPVEGVSFAGSFAQPTAPSSRETQYYEMFGCRAIYHKGWKAVAYHPIFVEEPAFEDDEWELYNVDEDLAECHDLAKEMPEKLQELIDMWWREARRYQVLPLDNRPFEAIFGNDPTALPARDRYVYYPATAPVPESAAVNVRNRSHTITAHVNIPTTGAQGMLLAQGSAFAGYALFMLNDRLHYVHNYCGLEIYRVTSSGPIPPGDHELAFAFQRTGEHQGVGRLSVDGAAAGEVTIPRFIPTRFSITGEGLCCGYDIGLPVCNDYRPPFRFTGTIHRVVVDVRGDAHHDARSDAEVALRAQ